MKKLKCHCGAVEGEVNVPEKGFEKVMRCNCSICKRKGYIIGVVGSNDFKKPIPINGKVSSFGIMKCLRSIKKIITKKIVNIKSNSVVMVNPKK